MPKKLKIGDIVFHGEPPIPYAISEVDEGNKTADLQSTGKVRIIHHHVGWSELTLLDESQNALRIVREATEDD